MKKIKVKLLFYHWQRFSSLLKFSHDSKLEISWNQSSEIKSWNWLLNWKERNIGVDGYYCWEGIEKFIIFHIILNDEPFEIHIKNQEDYWKWIQELNNEHEFVLAIKSNLCQLLMLILTSNKLNSRPYQFSVKWYSLSSLILHALSWDL